MVVVVRLLENRDGILFCARVRVRLRTYVYAHTFQAHAAQITRQLERGKEKSAA